MIAANYEHGVPEIAVRSNSRPAPSPDEIRIACQEIQKEWSEKERRRRAGRVRHLMRIYTCSAPVAAAMS